MRKRHGSRCARSTPSPPPKCSPCRARCEAYSTTPASDSASASSATAASSPSARTWSVVPAVAPSPSTLRMLFASASRPFAATTIFERKRIAVRTKSAAGRAWSATPSGSVMVASELASIAGLFSSLGHLVERCSRRSDDRGCHRALDEGRIDKPDVAVAVAAEHLAHGEDGAAEVAEQQDAVALIGSLDGREDEACGSAAAPRLGNSPRL